MPQLNAAGIVSSDMARSIAFYRALGLDLPETPGEGHLEATSDKGFRLMLDSEDVIKSFRPDWGQRYAQLADPDGVPVDLFAAL